MDNYYHSAMAIVTAEVVLSRGFVAQSYCTFRGSTSQNDHKKQQQKGKEQIRHKIVIHWFGFFDWDLLFVDFFLAFLLYGCALVVTCFSWLLTMNWMMTFKSFDHQIESIRPINTCNFDGPFYSFHGPFKNLSNGPKKNFLIVSLHRQSSCATKVPRPE